MKPVHHHFRRPVLVVGVVACCLFAARAQGLKNIIPVNQDPLSKTFPPKVTEQTAPGTGKFIILARKSVGASNEWDFIAEAWECTPSRPEVPLTKRIEFCHSSWDPSPLLDVLVRDGSVDQYPRFVSLQVDTGDRDYSVNLYDINYRTWDARCIWQGSRLSAFGVMKGKVFCSDAGKWFCLDTGTGAIPNEVPFIPIEVDGAYWLVRKPGEAAGCWSYDSVKQQYAAHFSAVEVPEVGYRQSLLAQDGRSWAWVLAPVPREWRGGTLDGTFLLQRTDQSEDIRVPIRMQARRGSGRPVIPTEISLQFTPDGKAEFTALMDKAGKSNLVWSIEIATGRIMESSRPHKPAAERDFSTINGVPAPAYLRRYLKTLTHFGRRGLAPAFLLHMGVLKKQPEFADCEAGVSPDGRHILYMGRKGPSADVFIYGDLQTQQILRWPRPAEINRDDFMEFLWVETP